MTRSRKKTPVVAVTSAASDKRFKVIEHQRERAAVRHALEKGAEPPCPKAYGNPWKAPKDGKLYVGDRNVPIRK